MKERYAENSVFEEWTVTQYRYSKKIDSVFVTEFKTGSTTDIYEIDTLLINEKGQLLKYLDNDDNSQYEITYSYNADGSLKQEHIHVIDQMSDREFTTTYKYSKYKGIGSQINIKPWFALRNGGNLIQLFNLTDETETGKVTEPDGNIIISPEKKIKYEYTYYDTGYPKTMKETGSRDDNYLYSIEYIKAK